MKTKLALFILLGAATLVVMTPGASAQGQLGARKGPTSKIYVAETKGETQIQNGDKIYTARQAMAFDAPGTVIETKEESHNAFVYSNGTGIYVEQNTRIEISRFLQEPFVPNRSTTADALREPSVSQSDVVVVRGAVGICTNQLISGSYMNYSTPQALINIRGGKVSIQTSAASTIIDLLEGDITVRTSAKDSGGQVLHPGERAIVLAAAPGQTPAVVLSATPKEEIPALDDRVNIACNSRKTVSFEISDPKGSPDTQSIVAKPTVPANLPANIVISPDRLP